MKINLPKWHANQARWYRYWYPKRLTLKTTGTPAIYRWFFWVWKVGE